MYRVIGTKEFDASFEELTKRAASGDFDSMQLSKLILRGIEKLKYDYKYGEHVSKGKIPAEYTRKYGIENLWKLNLNSFWRMIYTIRGNDVEVISVVIEVIGHKEYDRKFGYKTS